MSTRPGPVAPTSPLPPDWVEVPDQLLALMRWWPELIDRVRYRQPAILPLDEAAAIPFVRVALASARSFRTDGGRGAVPSEVWRWLLVWRTTLERARRGGLTLTLDESIALDEAAALLSAVEATRAP